MNRLRFKYRFLLIGVILSFVFSGTDGTIRGKISDDEGSALVGAQIYIPSLSKGTTADIDGNFIILNVPVNTYEIRIQMIGYQTKVLENVSIVMDQTKWINVSLPEATLEGEVVYVSAEKALVEKGSTSKKVTIGKEAIETLPIRDVSQLYDLQSGVVRVESRLQGIPDHEDRGLEEVHVRGGRSGEIAYMIDGMYIRNPIYGGIGNGTRLNKFAIREFDWQPGGFNAEYGDAMSAVSNYHTMSGTNSFAYKFQYETSMLGEALGSRYDEIRDYHDYNIGLGGPIPFFKKIKLWFSGQQTSSGAYQIYEFDNITHNYERDKYFTLNDLNDLRDTDPNWDQVKYSYVAPWDDTEGFKGFGFDNTTDYFAKLTYDITSQLKLTLSYWNVEAHRKGFKTNFLYWNDGQNEIFRDTERKALEFNHTINEKSFYTLRISDFVQDQFIGVRWQDSDNDGLPDWYEWTHPAGTASYSDPYNANIKPFHTTNNGDFTHYDYRDGNGPIDYSSGWYYGAPVPGNYNWRVAESFTDDNQNGVWDQGEEWEDSQLPGQPGYGVWDGPELVDASIYRDGSYWLTPEMYADYEKFWDAEGAYLNREGLDPYMTLNSGTDDLYYYTAGPDSSSTFFLWDPLFFYDFTEGQVFGGSDKFYSVSTARTQEIRFDYTNQVTSKWKTRVGVDYKTHKLNYFEVQFPWDDEAAFSQRFSERYDDLGVDGLDYILWSECGQPDFGEGNGVWDGPGYYVNPCTGLSEYQSGEPYDDFNGDGAWNDFVEPEELSVYFQNTFEVPWMVINAGVRLDAVQYNSKIWADPSGNFTPYSPHFYFDCGNDLNPEGDPMCPGDYYQIDTGLNQSGRDVFALIYDNQRPLYNENYDPSDPNSYMYDYEGYGFDVDCSGDECFIYSDDNLLIYTPDLESEQMTSNDQRDPGEPTTDSIIETNNYSNVIFKPSEWLYKISPRIGISHVISDGATFTFNYGLYYQTPIYEFIYRNVNKLEDPEQAFIDAGQENSSIGNATMTAGRTQSYELAFNVQFSRKWAFSAGIWVKAMDQLTTASSYNSGIYEFKVAKNGDFGNAIGFDFTVENRGSLFNTTIQYTYSKAKASSEYDSEAFGAVEQDAAQQEFLMPYDRTHDLTLSLYTTKLPWGINAGLTGFYQSGQPYTPIIFEGSDPKDDLLNKYSKRAPATVTMNLSLSKEFKIKKHGLLFGVNIFNLLDNPYPVDIHRITGNADYPGEYYDRKVGITDEVSGSYWDRPWMYSSAREVNFFVRIDFE